MKEKRGTVTLHVNPLTLVGQLVKVGTEAPEKCLACAHPKAYFEINCECY